MASSIARNVRKRNQRGMVHPSMFKLIWRRRSNNGRSRSGSRPRTILARSPSEQPKEANEVSLPPSNSGESSRGPIQQSEVNNMCNANNPQPSILDKLEDVKTTFDPANTDQSSILEVLEEGRKEISTLKREIGKLLRELEEFQDKNTALDNKLNTRNLLLRELQKQCKQNSKIASSSADTFRTVGLLGDLKSD